jgi:hypothetical protein
MKLRLLSLALLTAASSAFADGVVVAPDAAPQVRLAAKEVRRYVYLRTGELLPVGSDAQGKVVSFAVDTSLASEEYRLKTEGEKVTISGGSPVAVLYGAYAFAEKLGIRFYLHGDVVPDGKIPLKFPALDETRKPLFATRGIQPFHDFPEGPDWWNRDDWMAYVAQLPKLRMNFIGLHAYPDSWAGPEPLVWIGRKADVGEAGTPKYSHRSHWANIARPIWGISATKTATFAGGAAQLFPGDDYGNEVQEGMMPYPKTPDENNEVFRRSADMFGRAFARAKELGVKTCIGTETPLRIPKDVAARLAAAGVTERDAQVRELYEGMFTRIAKLYPVDYYWLWTPEGWTWKGNDPGQFENTRKDIRAALDALEKIGKPFTLATSGWVLGPMSDRSALDKFLPKDSPMSCLGRHVGNEGVEPAFANISARPKWAIPWLENDPHLTQPQPWVARMRYDAADAKRFGCTGILGCHWRTKAMMQNISAFAAAAWDQSWTPSSYDATPLSSQSAADGASGGAMAISAGTPADTADGAIYGDAREGMSGYKLNLPDGVYKVTLKFTEPTHEAAGKRVFGVKLQGKPVVGALDLFAKVGKGKPLDLTFEKIAVNDGVLKIDFIGKTGKPVIAGIVVEGVTKSANQIAGGAVSRKINCGGGALQDYEADRTCGLPAPSPKERAMPIADFYDDFARANFGAEVAAEAGALMASVDGLKMPQITDWVGAGPGCLKPSGEPWATAKRKFEFVETFAKIRPRVVGAGNIARFDYWLETYRAAESILRVSCVRGELDRAVATMKAPKNAAKKKELAEAASGVRTELARAWATLLSRMVSICDTPGELGTIANFETQSRNTLHILDKHDAAIAAALGAPKPAEWTPSGEYAGAPRLSVPTVRTGIAKGEALALTIAAPDKAPVKSVVLKLRPLGSGTWKTLDAKHQARALWRVELPAASEDFEYYIEAQTASGGTLRWPASAPEMNQTVIVE